MKLINSLIVFILRLGIVVALENEISIILDVVRSYDRPTAVVANICWGLADKMKLASELMNTDNPKTIQFIKEIRAIEKYKTEGMLIVLDMDCHGNLLFLNEANKLNQFKKPYRWMIFSTKKNLDTVTVDIQDLSILVDSEVIVAYNVNLNETLLRKVYRIDSTTDFIIEEFAIWSLENGLSFSQEAKDTTVFRRKNLRGKQIGMSVVSVDNTTKTEIYNLKNLVTDNISKSTFHNILPLYHFMNATTELLFTDTWGYFINNSWNGMIGQILRGEADLCGTIILMRLNRVDQLSFLTQPIHIQASFVFREPPLSFQNNLFYLPFRTTVWLCTGALVVLLVLVVYLTAKWEAKNNETENDDPTILKPNVSDVAIFVAGAVVQQSGPSGLKGSHGRIVTFIMFLIFLFLYTSYSANIVALLQSSSDQIRTLADLLTSKLELGVEDQPYTRYYFTTATERVRKAIYENKVARTGYKPNFMSIEEGVKKLKDTNAPFAFHMNLGLGYKFVEQIFFEHEKCGLREIQYIPHGLPWVCCKKQSPYQEIYKIGLARIIEHGISDRINRLIYARKPSCNSRGRSFGSVNMMDFHPVLLCLLYGMVASLVLLVLEILVHKRQMVLKLMRKSGTDLESRGDDFD